LPLKLIRASTLAFACLALPGAATAGEALDSLRELLTLRAAAFGREYGERMVKPESKLQSATRAALSDLSLAERRRMGTGTIKGVWQAHAEAIATQICKANGWICQPVVISDHLAPRVAEFDGTLRVSRTALALARNDSELAAMMLPTLWLYNQDELIGKIALANTATAEVPRDYPSSRVETERLAAEAAVQLVGALFWGTQIEGRAAMIPRYADALSNAGYNGEAAKSVDLLVSHWDRLQSGLGVGSPDFAPPHPVPADDGNRTPTDPAYLRRLDGLPMGVAEGGSLLVGRTLLFSFWRLKLVLPRDYDWRPFGTGAIASEPWQAEEVTIEAFDTGGNLFTAPFFKGLPDYLHPMGPTFVADNDRQRPMQFTLSRGRTGTRHDQPEITAYSANWGGRAALLVSQSGLADEAPRRRQELMESLEDRILRLNEEDEALLKPRTLRLTTVDDEEAAARLLARLSPEEERLLRVLNGLSAMERLPVGTPLKIVRRDLPPLKDIVKKFVKP
jgi:hypothetical protein